MSVPVSEGTSFQEKKKCFGFKAYPYTLLFLKLCLCSIYHESIKQN